MEEGGMIIVFLVAGERGIGLRHVQFPLSLPDQRLLKELPSHSV
jgi:hypothetical protein